MMDDPYLSSLPKANKHFQILSWTQSQQAPGAMEQYDDFFYGNSSMTSLEMEELHRKMTRTRCSRLRESLFPDTGPVRSLALAAAPTVTRLQEAALQLKHAVLAIINYEEDADCAALACDQLVPLLLDNSDPGAQTRAILFVRALAKKQASRAGFANDERLIPVVVDLLASDKLPDEAGEMCAALEHLSRSGTGARRLFYSAGIPALVRMLSSSRRSVIHYAVCTLRNLLLFVDEARREIRLCGGVGRLTRLLWRHYEDRTEAARFLALNVDCLHMLSVGSPQTKEEICSDDVLGRLAFLIINYSYRKLWHTISRLIRSLSSDAGLKPRLVNAGMVTALATMLARLEGEEAPCGASLSPRSQRQEALLARQRLACLWALRNLSDKAYHILRRDTDAPLDQLVMSLLNQLDRAPDHHVITCCAGILCNLTCQNTATKECVVEYGGVEALTHILVHNWDRDEIVEPVLCALTHLTRGHTHDHAARSLIPQCPSALSTLVRLVGPRSGRLSVTSAHLSGLLSPAVPHSGPDYRWPVVRAGLGLIHNLCVEENTREQLKQEGLLTQLPSHLGLVCSSCGLHGPVPLRSSSRSVCQAGATLGGVAVEDLLECLLLGFHALMKEDQEARLWLLGLTPASPDEDTPTQLALRVLSIQPSSWRSDDPQGVAWSLVLRAALAFLSELALEETFAVSLHCYIDPLLRVLRQRDMNEGLALFCAIILHRVSLHLDEPEGRRLRKKVERALGVPFSEDAGDGTVEIRSAVAAVSPSLRSSNHDRLLNFTDSGYTTNTEVGFNPGRGGEWVSESGV